MTVFRAVLVLLSWVTGTIAAAFALTGGSDSIVLWTGGVAAVSAVTAWGLTLKADWDMERYRAGRENEWARRLQDARWRDDYFEQDHSELLQLPERFDAG